MMKKVSVLFVLFAILAFTSAIQTNRTKHQKNSLHHKRSRVNVDLNEDGFVGSIVDGVKSIVSDVGGAVEDVAKKTVEVGGGLVSKVKDIPVVGDMVAAIPVVGPVAEGLAVAHDVMKAKDQIEAVKEAAEGGNTAATSAVTSAVETVVEDVVDSEVAQQQQQQAVHTALENGETINLSEERESHEAVDVSLISNDVLTDVVDANSNMVETIAPVVQAQEELLNENGAVQEIEQIGQEQANQPAPSTSTHPASAAEMTEDAIQFEEDVEEAKLDNLEVQETLAQVGEDSAAFQADPNNAQAQQDLRNDVYELVDDADVYDEKVEDIQHDAANILQDRAAADEGAYDYAL